MGAGGGGGGAAADLTIVGGAHVPILINTEYFNVY